MKPLLLIPLLVLAACTTLSPQQQALVTAAKPIADAAITAGAARYGVSPTTTQLVIDALYGAGAQAAAGQPVANGTTSAAVGAAIVSAVPAGTPDQRAALLQAAAGLVK